MKRFCLAIAALWSCTGPLNEPEVPVLCVQSVSAAVEDCFMQISPVALKTDRPVLVRHVLPSGVEPYGRRVNMSARPGSGVQSAEIEYALEEFLADGGPVAEPKFIAKTIFDVPDGGDCVILFSASILNSTTVVQGNLEGRCK